MLYKILLGGIRTDKGNYKTGDIIELSKEDAEALIREGVVEKVTEKVKPSEPEPVTEVKEETPEVEEVKAETDLEELTKSELLDYAKEKGLEVPENASKKEILDLLKS